jgi:hypothetical protein
LEIDMADSTMVETHPFGESLGPAPYRFIGVFQMPAKGSDHFTQQAGLLCREWSLKGIGGCHHCGTGIVDHFVIRTGDGAHHAVGSTCIAKVQKESGLIPKTAAAAKRAKRDLDRVKRHAREAAQLITLTAIMADPATAAALGAMPHSRGFKDFKTGVALTAWDDAQWMFSNAGASGKGKLLKRIQRALAA